MKYAVFGLLLLASLKDYGCGQASNPEAIKAKYCAQIMDRAETPALSEAVIKKLKSQNSLITRMQDDADHVVELCDMQFTYHVNNDVCEKAIVQACKDAPDSGSKDIQCLQDCAYRIKADCAKKVFPEFMGVMNLCPVIFVDDHLVKAP